MLSSESEQAMMAYLEVYDDEKELVINIKSRIYYTE
jgi:hypothetical protein